MSQFKNGCIRNSFFISVKRSIEGFQGQDAGRGGHRRADWPNLSACTEAISMCKSGGWATTAHHRTASPLSTPAELANVFGHCQVSPVLFGLGSRHAIDHCQHD